MPKNNPPENVKISFNVIKSNTILESVERNI